ncbi:trypsin-like serine protease [Pseudomonas sp. 3MA1]|uniref:S1C family serine protease n=1 Tax=Pseudomonas sp. 3MA1 TaxID=2699196 RepID=UPI0023DDD83B|nr:serine protease [Pseudomonas sp. 3MA1]MDF2395930.1 trypsin-like serine protease [Pseudomonas sp. 3MA1]
MTGMNQLATALLLTAMPLGMAQAMDASCLFQRNKEAMTRIDYTCILTNGDGKCESSGSGFIVSESGLVITNNHVISPVGNVTVESETIQVKVGSRGAGNVPATVVARDKVRDIALLQLAPRDNGKGWQAVAIGTAVPTPVAAPLMALGYGGWELSLIPSGMKTAELAEVDGGYKPWWQTNLALNEGHSGGPVFGSNGTVIGISVAYKRSSQLVSYVIPIYYAKPFLDQAGARSVTYGSCVSGQPEKDPQYQAL